LYLMIDPLESSDCSSKGLLIFRVVSRSRMWASQNVCKKVVSFGDVRKRISQDPF
jgi:hypothetical protein